jgi:hypothetical protein
MAKYSIGESLWMQPDKRFKTPWQRVLVTGPKKWYRRTVDHRGRVERIGCIWPRYLVRDLHGELWCVPEGHLHRIRAKQEKRRRESEARELMPEFSGT